MQRDLCLLKMAQDRRLTQQLRNTQKNGATDGCRQHSKHHSEHFAGV